ADAVVDDRVDGDHDVVLGDDLLWVDLDDPLAHLHLDDALDHRNHERQARIDAGAVLPESHDQPFLVLPDDARRARHHHQCDEQEDGQEHDIQSDRRIVHVVDLTRSVTPFTPSTATTPPGSKAPLAPWSGAA